MQPRRTVESKALGLAVTPQLCGLRLVPMGSWPQPSSSLPSHRVAVSSRGSPICKGPGPALDQRSICVGRDPHNMLGKPLMNTYQTPGKLQQVPQGVSSSDEELSLCLMDSGRHRRFMSYGASQWGLGSRWIVLVWVRHSQS